MKKFVLLLCVLLLGRASGEEAVYFADDTGREIALPQTPKRVAVLFSSFAEMWHIAGGDIHITVGETVERGIAKADILLVDDGAGKQINQELLLHYAPDFVIASADIPSQVDAAIMCEKAGIPSALFRVDSFWDYLRVFEVMTRITGRQDLFEIHGRDVQKQVEGLLAETKGEEAGTFLLIRAGSGLSSTKAKHSCDHFAAAMLVEMGLKNIADKTSFLQDTVSMEYVLIEDPDYLFFSLMGNEENARMHVETLLQGEEYGALSAVRENRAYILPKELFHFKPNHRWGESYLYLRNLVRGGV